MSGPPVGSRRPWARTILGAGLLAASAYTIHRAVTLRTEYSDGYAFLMAAQRFGGDHTAGFDARKPPLVALVQVPVVMAARAAGPASRWLLVGPHLASALLSLLTAAAVFLLYRAAFPHELALLGTLLFAGSRLFVRYGAHVMSDIPATGLCAAAVALFLLGRSRPGTGRALLAQALGGAAAGAAILTRPGVAPILGSLVATEALLQWGAARGPAGGGVGLRPLAGLAVACLTAMAVFAAVQTVVLRELYPADGWRLYWEGQRSYGSWVAEGMRRERRLDHLTIAWAVLSPPLLLLSVAGLAIALRRPEPRDAPFFPWLLLLGGGHVLLMRHSEARYFLPATPALLYFAVRAIEAAAARLATAPVRSPAARLGKAGLVASVAAVLLSGVRQGWDDRDPIFGRDVERRATAKMLALRRGDGRLLTAGPWHTLFPAAPPRAAQDEFWNTFNLSNGVFQYYAGQPVMSLSATPADDPALHLLLAQDGRDGDVVARLAGRLLRSDLLVPGDVPAPLPVLAVKRIDLRRGTSAERGWMASGADAFPARLGHSGLGLEPPRPVGEHLVFARRPGVPQPELLGTFDIRPGTIIPLGDPSAVDAIVMLRLELHEVPAVSPDAAR